MIVTKCASTGILKIKLNKTDWDLLKYDRTYGNIILKRNTWHK